MSLMDRWAHLEAQSREVGGMDPDALALMRNGFFFGAWALNKEMVALLTDLHSLDRAAVPFEEVRRRLREGMNALNDEVMAGLENNLEKARVEMEAERRFRQSGRGPR